MTKRNDDGVWLQRRRVLMAGGAGMLAPAAGFGAAAGPATPAAERDRFGEGGGRLVLSGRLKDADARPLAGKAFEVHGASGRLAHATTDGDGRFVLEMPAPAGLDRLALHLDGARPQGLALTRGSARGTDALAQVERDDTGVWRAAVGVTFA